ncbi:lactate/malate family dehydrogenase [Alkaliphilus hydrothermalis]|uniref:Malate/lactate dehydrogenase n=1 Tax=Alkaliphilus hydrothermalis TaxID=1482730 RepID=A0ABS2NN02_9FIRM|nr:lactate dehydrogenase [Alkaliphilus hydrothermalis]MBM7614308.1 malate/lactate dehydrogenase [Alkaliphilus hydrothermalis]
MKYYRLKDKILFSLENYPNLTKITEEEAQSTSGLIYFLKHNDNIPTRRSFCLAHPQMIYSHREDLSLLQREQTNTVGLPQWVFDKIQKREVMAINTAFKSWQEPLFNVPPKKWRVNIAGLGDVGGTLLIGLRLLGGDIIDSIGIYDRDLKKLQRWEQEINQINGYNTPNLPDVRILKEDEVFDCDAFVFCIAAHVPEVGKESGDVRMVQLEANSKIIGAYGTLARQAEFKGIFAVVSDPVDLLCKAVYLASNTNEEGQQDEKGLAPEQVRGYGLGVMNARALYYANKRTDTKNYVTEGRAFGPHGAGLIIANSIENYHQELSLYLTEKARTANLEVRETGYKPYIAPALSSGTLSILDTLRGEWHYSATYMGGVYMGAKNRLLPSGTEVEILDLPPQLMERLQATYDELRDLL